MFLLRLLLLISKKLVKKEEFMFYSNSLIKYIFFFWICCLLASCSSSEDKSSIDYELNFKSAKVANTDIRARRATPLKIRVFFLRSNIRFFEADFFGLQNEKEDAPAILGEELLKIEQFFLLSEENKTISGTTPQGTRYIGIIAEYLQLDNKIWRVALPIADESSWSFRTLWSGNKYYELDIKADQKGLVIDN